MGNSSSVRFNSVVTDKKDTRIISDHVCGHSKVLSLDPRSPTEGIVRTPIQIDKENYDARYIDPRSPSAGVTRTPIGYATTANVGDIHVLDLNNFETLDGVLTEDDSIHRSEVEGDKVSALSDTEVTNNSKGEGHHNVDKNYRTRLSWWLDKRVKRKSMNDSPGLFVRLRHKQNYEKHRTEQQNYLGGDMVSSTYSNSIAQQSDHK